MRNRSLDRSNEVADAGCAGGGKGSKTKSEGALNRGSSGAAGIQVGQGERNASALRQSSRVGTRRDAERNRHRNSLVGSFLAR